MRALESHCKVDKGTVFTSLPLETEGIGLYDRGNFVDIFKKTVQDLKRLGQYDCRDFTWKVWIPITINQ